MMRKIFVFLLLVYFTAVNGYRRYLDAYWIHVKDEYLQEYRQNGRSCEECQFPFSHDGTTNYGCRPYEDFEYACKNTNGTFVKCPDTCPYGSAKFWRIDAMSGDDDNSVVLECYGYGSPNPTLTWQRDDLVLDVVEPPAGTYPVMVNASLTLKYSSAFYGLYSCHLDNGYSSDSSDDNSILGSYNFKGRRLPTMPTNLRVISLVRTYLTLAWDFNERQPSQSRYQTSYDIFMTPGRPPSSEKLDVVLIRSKNYTIKHLQPGVEYTFKVRRRNAYGKGLYSEPLHYTIPENAPLDRPVNLTATAMDPTTVHLAWNMEGEDEPRGYRKICIIPGKHNQNRSCTGLFHGNKRTVENLLPNTQYTFEVEAIIAFVHQRKSEAVHIKTEPLGASVKHLRVEGNDHYVVKIKCEVVGGPIPEVTWKRDKEPIQDKDLVNTTQGYGKVTSVLTLPRTAFVYTQYSCEGRNEVGNHTRYVTVRYTGDHPPVALERNVLNLYEDLKKMKQDLANDLKTIKEDLEILKNVLT